MRVAACAMATVLVAAIGCGGDDAPAAATTITQLVGPEGGTVELRNGGKVEIPPGALSQPVSIKISERHAADVAPLPSNLEVAGKPYSFEPHGQVFAVPVKLEVPFEGDATEVRPMKLPDEDAATSQWTTVFPNEKVGNKVSMQSTSFSVIVAARPRRGSGVITLPDGAVVTDDAGLSDSGTAGTGGGDGGAGGDAGAGGDGGDAGPEPLDASIDASIDATTSTDAGDDLPRVTGVYDADDKPLWNRWVLNDGDGPFDATGAACDMLSATRRDECLHTGELLQVTFPDLGSCDGLVIHDTADALRWVCEQSDDQTVLRSEGLRDSVGITDVVDWNTGTFRALSVVVSRDSQEIARTTPEIWWRNEVVTVDNTTPTSFTGNQRVYLALTDPGRFISISSDDAVYAVRPGVVATAPTGSSVVRLNGTLHAWVEGSFDGTGLTSSSTNVVQVVSLRCTVRGVSIRNAVARGLGLSCGGGRVDDVEVQDTANEGIYSSGRYMSFRHIHVHHTGTAGFLQLTPAGTLMQTVRVHDTGGLCLNVNNSTTNLNPALDRHVEVRDVRLSACGSGGANMVMSASIIENLHVRKTNHPALNLYLQQSVVRDVTVIGINGSCIDARSSSHTVWSSVLCAASGSNSGSHMVALDQNTHGSIVSGLTVLNNTRTAMFVEGADNSLINLAGVNNGERGFRVVTRANRMWNLAFSSNNVHETTDTFADLSSAFTGATLVPNVYGGILLFGTGPRGCYREGGVSELNAGITTACNSDVGSFPGVVYASEIPWSTFVGPMLSDEPVNTSDTDGSAMRTEISDWAGFAHDGRGWAIDDGASPASMDTFPGPTFRGACTTQETCRIWDHDLTATDTTLRNRLPWPPTNAATTIPLVITHTFAGATQAQCADIVGASWDGSACTIAFLNHAMELSDGNGNGLCESGETCLHTPNYGRYQGHGALVEVDTNVAAAPLSGIRLYRYAQNGR